MKLISTNSIVSGDIIKWTEAVFTGSFRKPKFTGERTITARVERESYGAKKQQHTFSLTVIESEGEDAPSKGATIKRKGRNLYKGLIGRAVWHDESARNEVAAEKHARGHAARQERAIQRGF